MDSSKIELPPPYLLGIHLRDDFNFKASGSAIAEASEPSIETSPEPEMQGSAMMSDDEFLKSLLTVSDDQPIGGFNEVSEDNELNSSAPDPGGQPIQAVPSLDSVSPHKPPGFEKITRADRFPFSIPWVPDFDLKLKSAVTFLVGENGSGKSTLIEAIASMCGFPVCGGGKNDLASQFGPDRKSELAEALYLHFGKRPRDGYFSEPNFMLSLHRFWINAPTTLTSKGILTRGTADSLLILVHTVSLSWTCLIIDLEQVCSSWTNPSPLFHRSGSWR